MPVEPEELAAFMSGDFPKRSKWRVYVTDTNSNKYKVLSERVSSLVDCLEYAWAARESCAQYGYSHIGVECDSIGVSVLISTEQG